MGTGGSRFGAGRPTTKAKAESCLRLDVRHWQREGVLRPGRTGSWQWTSTETGEPRGSISYRVNFDTVTLTYAVNDKPCAQTVHLDHTPCTYGSERPWFVCPVRGERVAMLYLRAGRFACRHCQRIAYASQSGDMFDGISRRQRKAEARLNDYWQRPKGMHQTTHQRLLSIILDCEERREEALDNHLSALMRLHPLLFHASNR